MIKLKNIYFLAYKEDERYFSGIEEYDQDIQNFINFITSEGHTFISINTVSFGRFENANRIRTTITYREEIKRKVLIEKNKK